MDAFNVLFIGAVALLFVYLYLKWSFNYWKARGIDYDDQVNVFFGSLTDSFLGKKAVGEIYTSLYGKFPEKKVVGYFRFRNPGLIVRDPEIIRKILITDFSHFLNNDVTINPDADPIMGKNAFVQKDEAWKRTRSMITPAFTAGKIKAIYPLMREVAKDLVKYLKEHPEEVMVKPIMSRYTSEVVARCAFGIEGHNFEDSEPEMQEMGKAIFNQSFIQNFKMMMFFLSPTFTKLLRLRMVPKKVIDFFDLILRDVIVYRQKNNITRIDLVHYFIEIKRKGEEIAKGNMESDVVVKGYTDDDILGNCITFFVEGYETTAIILNNALYYLAMNKEVQETLRAEIDEALQEGDLTFEKLNALPYLHAVFAETGRMLPVLFSLQKTCTQKYEMDIGKDKPLVIEKGTSIVIPHFAIQHDPLYWEDPETFKPDRFLSKESEPQAKARGVYMPFGDGPRMCPGTRIATTMVKLALVEILSQLEVQPTSRTPKKIEPHPNYFMIVHKGGIFLRFVERSH